MEFQNTDNVPVTKSLRTYGDYINYSARRCGSPHTTRIMVRDTGALLADYVRAGAGEGLT